jgi:hypothetical protein
MTQGFTACAAVGKDDRDGEQPAIPLVSAGDARAAAPYESASEYLQDELQRLAHRLGSAVRGVRHRPTNDTLDAFRGLVISDEEVASVVEELAAPRNQPGEAPDSSGPRHDSLKLLERRIEARLAATVRAGILPPLLRLRRLFQLTPFEEQCLIVCVAPELDRRYEKLYGYLQDDVTRTGPSVALLLDLLCPTPEEKLAARRSFDPQAPLGKFRLCRIQESPPDAHGAGGASSLLSRTLSIDDRLVNFLLGRERIDARLDDVVRPYVQRAPLAIDANLERQVRSLVEARCAPHAPPLTTILHLCGPRSSEGRSIAEAVCNKLGIALIVVDLERLLVAPARFGELLWLLAREAMLMPAALCLENFDSILVDPAKNGPHLRVLLEAIRLCSRITFLLGRDSWLPHETQDAQHFFPVNIALPEIGASRTEWENQARLDPTIDKDVDWGSLASRFRFGSTQIRDVLTVAKNLARWRTSNNEARVTMAELNEACRTVGAKRLSALGRKLPASIAWDELVLPPPARALLEDLCNQARHRQRVLGDWGFDKKLSLGRGLSALFSGPPGTGKTMAAQVIAGALELDLYRIDLSQVVSKYIGEIRPVLRRGRRPLRQALGRKGRPRPLRQHRGRLPLATDGGVRGDRDSRHQPAAEPRRGLRAPPALHRRIPFPRRRTAKPHLAGDFPGAGAARRGRRFRHAGARRAPRRWSYPEHRPRSGILRGQRRRSDSHGAPRQSRVA